MREIGLNRNLNTTPKRRSRSDKDLVSSILFFFLTLFFIAGILTYLWVYNEVNITLQEITSLDQLRESISSKNHELSNEIIRLSRVDRVTEIAKRELQMVTPEPETLVVVTHYPMK